MNRGFRYAVMGATARLISGYLAICSRRMSLELLKREISALSAQEQRQLTAFLVALQDTRATKSIPEVPCRENRSPSFRIRHHKGVGSTPEIEVRRLMTPDR